LHQRLSKVRGRPVVGFTSRCSTICPAGRRCSAPPPPRGVPVHHRPRPDVSRRALLGSTGALMTTAALTAPSAANAAPRLRPAGPVPTEPQTTTLEPVIEGPAAMTAAVRGSAYLDGLIHIASRHTVSPGVVRLGSFDPFSGEQAGIRDLDIEAGAGNTSLTADDRYVYIGPAGSAFVWRFDPQTDEVEQFAEVGGEN